MASTSKHDDQRTHEVSIPLLQDNEDADHHTSAAASSSSHTPRRDVRFAISEEDAEDDAHADDSDPLVSSQPNSKYPPLPNSLPPSYREAVYKKDPWYKSEVALSLQHYGLICFSGLGTFFRRYWPTSRFAQAGFFIVGLWIIVIVTGPTWDKSAKLGWGKSVDEFLASIPPPPISGDGHFTSLADWSMPSCRSIPSGLSTYCSRTSTYRLPIPHEKDAWMTSDKIFLFVDPVRLHQSEDRGTVPASVRIHMDGTVKGEVKVAVKAHYEKEMEPLLERANVGMMKAGLVDQGVGIYTWPLPPRLAELTARDPDHFPYPLLSFDVDIHVEPHSAIPNFLLEGAQMDVGFFSEPTQSIQLPAKRNDSPPMEDAQMSDAVKEKLSHARFGHAIGLAKQQRQQQEETEQAEKRQDGPPVKPAQLSDSTKEKLSHAHFGHAMGMQQAKEQEDATNAKRQDGPPVKPIQMSDATEEKLSHARVGHAMGMSQQQQEPAKRQDSPPVKPMQMSDATKEKLSHARVGHAMGLSKQQQQQRQQTRAVDGDDDPHTYFGSTVIKVDRGNLVLGDKIRTAGQMVLKTQHGDIALSPSSSLRAAAMYLETQNGNVKLGGKSALEARDIMQVITRNGSLTAEDGVQVKGTRVNGEAHLGALDSKYARWTSNHTLLLTSRDDLAALAGIEPPWRPALGTGTEQHAWVSVDATSEQGRVDVTFPEHVRNTPLRGKFGSNGESSSSSVSVQLHPEYAGSFVATAPASAKGSSSVNPPKDGSSPATQPHRKRIFEVKDRSDGKKYLSSGEVWWADESTGASGAGSSKPTGEEWGSVELNSKGGGVSLGFDAV